MRLRLRIVTKSASADATGSVSFLKDERTIGRRSELCEDRMPLGAVAIGGGGNLFPLMRQHQRKVRTGKGNLLWKAQMGVILWMP